MHVRPRNYGERLTAQICGHPKLAPIRFAIDGAHRLRDRMYDFPLTGAQKSFLRGLGQRLEPGLKLGRGGLTPALFAELQQLLRRHELVKIRFVDADRQARAELCSRIADEGRCICVGAVGHTALFYRQQPDAEKRVIALP